MNWPKTTHSLHYILGRFEGIAFALEGNAKNALLDTCEMLGEYIAAVETIPFKEADDGEALR